MRQSQEFSWSKTVMVFCTALLIFLLGMITNNALNEAKLLELEVDFDQLRVDGATLEVEYALFQESSCDVNPTVLSDQLHQVGNRLNFMETQLGFDNPSVVRFKEFYSLMEVRHWLVLENINKVCGQTYKPILFFYGNEKSCPSCAEQGYVIDAVRKTHEDISVYSFDVGLNNPALTVLKAKFAIRDVPTIVIGNTTVTGFLDKYSIESILYSKDLQS